MVVVVVVVVVVEVVVEVVVIVVVDVVVEGISLAQHPSLDLHFSESIQASSSAQNRVPSGLQGSTLPFPLLQRQYLDVQHPSDRKVIFCIPWQRTEQSGSG